MATALHVVTARARLGRPARPIAPLTPPNPVEVSALRTIMRVTPRRRRVAVALAFMGWKQRDLGAHLGMSVQDVSSWTTGERLPKFLACEAIAEALGLDLNEMWGN